MGAYLNVLVMTNNGGRMPVGTPYFYPDNRHVAMTEDTQYKYLGDIIHIGHAWYSIGDILISINPVLYFLDSEKGKYGHS